MKRFLKFGLVGVAGYVTDIGVLWLVMNLLNLGPYSGRVISFICAASTTWIGNRLFTFRDRPQTRPARQWLAFVIVSTGGFALNYGAYALLITTVPFVRENLPLGVAAGAVAGMFFNYFVASAVVFPQLEKKENPPI